jgi:hypothetical protein
MVRMKLFTRRHLTLVALSLVFVSWQLRAQEEPLCVENSPERRGEIECSIIDTKLLPADLKEPVFWHIDRFKSGDLARAAVGLQALLSRRMELGGLCRWQAKITIITEVNTSPQ